MVELTRAWNVWSRVFLSSNNMVGLSEASGGSMSTSEKFSGSLMTTTTPPSWDVVDAGAPLAIPAPPYATVTETTPKGSAGMDKRLLEELIEARSTNERYKRMLVRKLNL